LLRVVRSEPPGPRETATCTERKIRPVVPGPLEADWLDPARIPSGSGQYAQMDSLRTLKSKAEYLSETDSEESTKLWQQVYDLAASLSGAPAARANPFLGQESVEVMQEAIGRISMGVSGHEAGETIKGIVRGVARGDSLTVRGRPDDLARADMLYQGALSDIARLWERHLLQGESQTALLRLQIRARGARERIREAEEVYAGVHSLDDLLMEGDFPRARELINTLLNRPVVDEWLDMQVLLHDKLKEIEPYLYRVSGGRDSGHGTPGVR
jgi:hypothetical protein